MTWSCPTVCPQCTSFWNDLPSSLPPTHFAAEKTEARGGNSLTQGYPACNWQSQDLKTGLSDSQPFSFLDSHAKLPRIPSVNLGKVKVTGALCSVVLILPILRHRPLHGSEQPLWL